MLNPFQDCVLTIGSQTDAKDCLALRSEVVDELARLGKPELCLARETPEEFCRYFVDPESRALVLRAPDGELAAFGLATYTGRSRESFRPLIPDFDDSPRNVGYVKLIQVKRSYRGRGLQRFFFSQLEQYFRENGTKYSVGTVSPNNLASLTNFQQCGYHEAERFIVQPLGYVRIRMIKTL